MDDAARIAATIDPDNIGKLRMGIFIDRAEGKAFAIILNRENHKWAPLTVSEHPINGDDFDSVFDAVNEVCADITRWSETSDAEIQ